MNTLWQRIVVRRLQTIYRVVRDVIQLYVSRNGRFLAASISFYTILSLVPFLLLISSIAGFILWDDAGMEQWMMDQIQFVIPEWEDQTGRDSLEFLERNSILLFVVGFTFLLFTCRNLLGSMIHAFHEIQGGPSNPGILRQIFNIGMVLVAFVLVVVISVVLNIGGRLPAGLEIINTVQEWIQYYFLFNEQVSAWLLSSLIFAILFGFLPSRFPGFLPVLIGALFAGLVWEAGKTVFSIYFIEFLGRFEAIYGGIASIIFSVLWAYVFGLSCVLGFILTSVTSDLPHNSTEDRGESEKEYLNTERESIPFLRKKNRLNLLQEGARWKNRKED